MLTDWPIPSEFPALSGDELHLWAVRLDRVPVAELSLAGALSAEELARAGSYLVERPRRDFAASRVALRTILGRYLGDAPGEVPLVVDPRGKPRLAVGELQFNQAHSGDLALIAVTRGCEVGIDVERLRPLERCEELARRYFHPREQSAVFAAAADSSSRAFLEIWTRKEAVLKAVGVGIGYPLSAFDTTAAIGAGRIELAAHLSHVATTCWLHSVEPGRNYLAAVATLAPRQPQLGFTYSL